MLRLGEIKQGSPHRQIIQGTLSQNMAENTMLNMNKARTKGSNTYNEQQNTN